MTTTTTRSRKPRVTVPTFVRVSPTVSGHTQKFEYPVRGVVEAACSCGWHFGADKAIDEGHKYIDARRAHNVHKAQVLGVTEIKKLDRNPILRARDLSDVVLTDEEAAAINKILEGARQRAAESTVTELVSLTKAA
jgi:hypothetical protein